MEITNAELVAQLQKSGIVSAAEVADLRQQSGLTDDHLPAKALVKLLVKQGKLTKFQAQLAYGGKAKNLVMGSYVILDKLGEGGMGQVYKARHKRMKREVALKILAPQFVKDEGALLRFHREVEAAARLTHQNIVTAYDADEVRGTHYLVMEYVRGEDLSNLVKRTGPLPVAQAVNCVLQAAIGLAYAHEQNVVHRDIKPSNLLLDESGVVKILDMGLARFDEVAGDADEAAALTGTGMLMGTVDYMSPEQAMDSKTADHRSDIYSLGCTLYLLITGTPVYTGDTMMKRVMAHQTTVIPTLPIDDELLQSVFEKMLAKQPGDRYQSTGDVVMALDVWLQDHRDQASLTATVEMPLHSDGSSITAMPGIIPESADGRAAGKAVQSKVVATAEPVSDTSPTSSAFAATVLPGKGQPADAQPASAAASQEPAAETNPAFAIETEPQPVLPSQRRARRQKTKRTKTAAQTTVGGGLFGNRKLLLAGGLAALILLGALIFRFTGKDGTVVVELDGPLDVATVEIDDKEVSFSPDGTDKRLTFKVDPGNHKLTIKTTGGLELTTDLGAKPLEIKAGDSTTLRAWVEKATPESGSQRTAEADKQMSTAKPDIAMDYAAERAAAEWWAENLKNGCLIVESEDGETTEITPQQRTLPDGNCALTNVIEADCGYVNDATIKRLADCRRLTGFYFSYGSSVTADGLAALRDVKTLTQIRILHNEVLDNRLWLLLKEWPDLETLNVEGCSKLSDPEVSAFSSLSKLKDLAVRSTQISDAGLKLFGKRCSAIEDIEVGYSLGETRRSLDSLRDLQGLRSVGCSVEQLTIPGVATLLNLPKFEVLRLVTYGLPTDEAISRLRPLHSKLQSLSVLTNRVGDTPPTSMSYAAICQITSLRDLKFFGNEGSLNDQDLLALSKLKHLSTLSLSFPEKASLPNYPEARRQYTLAGIEAFRKARPDVRLTADGVVYPVKEAVGATTKNMLEAVPKAPDVITDPKSVAGALAPLGLRMQPRQADLPKYNNTLRAGQPLGEFAAVSSPGKVNDIISWSIEPVRHRGAFGSIDVRDDGMIATGGHDSAIRLWSSEWKLQKILPGHANPVGSVKFSPDGKTLASVSSSPRDLLAIWDVASGQLLRYHDVKNWTGHLTWLPDGKQIIHCSQTGVEQIDPWTGQRREDDIPNVNCGSVAVSPDGSRLVAGREDGGPQILQTGSLKLLRQIDGHLSAAVDWSSDGKWILLSNSTSTTILDTRSFQERKSFPGGGMAKFSPDSTQLAVTMPTGLGLFKTGDWTEIRTIPWTVSYCFTWSADGRQLLTSNGCLDATTGKQLPFAGMSATKRTVSAVNSDGTRVATSAISSGRLRIWDGQTGQMLKQFPSVPNVTQLIWQPKGSQLLRVVSSRDVVSGNLVLVDTDTGQTSKDLTGHQAIVWRAAWSPDGSRVASVGEDGACRLWNASTGIEELKLTHDDPLWWVQWSHDGSKVATGSSFSSISVWDAKDGERIKEFKTLSQPMRAPIGLPAADAPFCFLQNNTQISYMAGDTGFELLDLKTGQITSIGQVEVPGGNRQTAAWSKDFKLLGIYDGYREFHLFGAGETKPVISIRYFTTPHWLADGRRILGGDNSAAWISGYDLRRKRRLGTLMPELLNNAWAMLGSDGQFVGSDDIEDHVVVVALHSDGRLLTLSPTEFQEHFGWKNDPSKVNLWH